MNISSNFHKIFEYILASDYAVYHATCVMHNTRTSKRMEEFGIKKGIGEYLLISDETHLLKIICKHITQNQLKILAINLCADHLHFAIICKDNQLESKVGKLKSMVAREFNIWRGVTVVTETRGHAPLSELQSVPLRGSTQQSLWAQKFNRVKITSVQQLYNVVNYIVNNRIKHRLLPFSLEMEAIVEQTIFNVS
jgi:REP element-mobilizing transposase RayT